MFKAEACNQSSSGARWASVLLEKRHWTPLVPENESQQARTWPALQDGLGAGGELGRAYAMVAMERVAKIYWSCILDSIRVEAVP